MSLVLQLKGIDTSFPSLAVGDHRVSIAAADLKESSKTPGLWMLKLQLETQEPSNNTKGQVMAPGHKFFTNITLPGQPGATPENEEMRFKSLASFVDAVMGTTQETRPDFDDAFIAALKDKQTIAVVKKAKDDSFGETEVKGFKPLA